MFCKKFFWGGLGYGGGGVDGARGGEMQGMQKLLGKIKQKLIRKKGKGEEKLNKN